MINYYALLLPILCLIWPVCVSENEKNQYQNKSVTLGHARLVPVYVHIFLKLDLHTANVIENVTKIPETTKKSL